MSILIGLWSASCEPSGAASPAEDPKPSEAHSSALETEPTDQKRGTSEATLTEAEATGKAQAAIGPFKKKLKAALMSAISEGGPVAAVDVCHEVAPKLAAEASSAKVTVGRSSHRLRNPDNAPADWLTPVLKELEGLEQPAGATRTVALGEGRYGYVEAIVTGPPCLLCHGDNVAPEVEATIAAHYPKDEATGFSPGALRGVFWAEVQP